MGFNDRNSDGPPDDIKEFTISISGIWNFIKDWRIKRDLNNIKKWRDNDECNECDSSIVGASGADKNDTGIDGGG